MLAPHAGAYWVADTTEELLDLTVSGLLSRAAVTRPEHTALVDGQHDPQRRRSWSYATLDAEVDAAAAALLARFAPGDRIAIWAPNRADWVILQQGVARAGMVTVALNPNYRSRELRYVLGQSRATGLFHTDDYRGFDMAGLVEDLRPELPALRHTISFTDLDTFLAEGRAALAAGPVTMPVVSPQEPAQIQYTSGTTGFPKGALLHHFGVVNASALALRRSLVGPDSVYVNAMPMYHIGGGSVTELGTFAAGGTFVLMPEFDPALLAELLETYRGTHTLLVPTMLLALLDEPSRLGRDLSSLQVVLSGSAVVPAPLVERVKDTLDCELAICFGQTELHGIITQTEPSDSPADQQDTIGRPMPHVDVRIVDTETGATAPIGATGEICARGYQTMLGYFELPEETAKTLHPDGWLHTGDLGSMDERGFLRITGRVKDMIIRGGMNISPREIEDVLFAHPAVAEVAVVGVPDDHWGEVVAAIVRPADPAAPPRVEELRAHCRASTAAFKTPARWYVVDAYPLTPSGKIQKFVLRDQIAAGSLAELT